MMRYRVVFAPMAADQIRHIYQYVASSSSFERAWSFTQAIVGFCQSLDTFPERGGRRDDLRPGLRIIGFRRRVTLAFEVTGELVTILGVFYGGADFERSFTEPEIEGN